MKNSIVQARLVIRSYIGAHPVDAEVLPLPLTGTAQVQAQRFPLTAPLTSIKTAAPFAAAGGDVHRTDRADGERVTGIRSEQLESGGLPADAGGGIRRQPVPQHPARLPPYAVMTPDEALEPPVTITDIRG